MADNILDNDNITCIDVHDLANSLQRCEGHYSFLIGAGTSKNAGIPTSTELVKKWRGERFEMEHSEKFPDEISDNEINEWAIEIEENEKNTDEHPYGFWFEKQYTTRGERRKFIQNLVKDKEPTFGHIILASLMKEGTIPLTLTTNFDDLLYDAFYLFLEEKPMMIGHDAIAPEFQLTRNRPTIIKLHGDYLYDNLKNTNSETNKLEKNIETALSRSLDEYGLVVTGYGGSDDSIMNVIKSETIPDYGLFWCVLDVDNVSDDVQKVLEKPNTFLVEIDGFEQLLSTLLSEIEDVSIPMPDEIKSRAKERENMLMEKVSETEGQKPLELFMSAQNYSQDGEYDTAITILTDLLDRVVEKDSETKGLTRARIYSKRGLAYSRKEDYDSAYEDYSELLQLNNTAGHYLNRAELSIFKIEPDDALADIEKAKKAPNDSINTGTIMFLEMVAHILKGDDHIRLKAELERQILNSPQIRWEFETMDSNLPNMSIEQHQKEKIYDLIDTIRSQKVKGPTTVTLEGFSEYKPEAR